MQQSERALERALLGHEYGMYGHLDRVLRDMDSRTMIHRHVERIDRDQARIHRDKVRAHRYTDRHNYRSVRKHAGKESHLRHNLLEDGLIDEYNSDISLTFSKNQIKINGVKLEGNVKEKYRRLLDEIYGENSTGELEFRH